ncbi:hypothetical protein MHYP_G00234690 [Metynnis hypsauchen]
MSKRGKKRNFTECEVEALLNEVEARKKVFVWHAVLWHYGKAQKTWDALPASLVHLASRRPPARPTCQQLMSVQPAVS